MADGSRPTWTARRVTLVGLTINVVLTVGKIVAGLVFRSQAIFADGLHSASDIVTDAAVLWGLRVSTRPADEDHHFGHLRAATLAAAFVGIMLALAALWIVVQALWTLHERHSEVRALVPLAWAVASVALKESLFRVTRCVGERDRDPSVVANAWHHRTDAFTSIAAAVGLGGVMLGGPAWAFLDHVTAIGLGVYLAYVASSIVRESAMELMDQAPRRQILDPIERVLAETPGVLGFHAVRARRIGGRVSMDVHVQVNPDLTVRAGHAIATEVERRIRESSRDVVHIVVHVEPSDDEPE